MIKNSLLTMEEKCRGGRAEPERPGMRTYILDSLSGAQLIAVYQNKKAPDRFFVGQIAAWREEGELLLKLISPEGDFDGFLLSRPEDIYRYEWGSAYLRELPLPAEELCGPGSAEDFFRMAQDQIIEVLGRRGTLLAKGVLLEITEGYMALQRVRADGRDGARCRYRLKSIGGIICGSKDAIDLTRLREEGKTWDAR